jgi:hypothetical protein
MFINQVRGRHLRIVPLQKNFGNYDMEVVASFYVGTGCPFALEYLFFLIQ